MSTISERQRIQYDRVNHVFANGNMTRADACSQVGISLAKYYILRKKFKTDVQPTQLNRIPQLVPTV